MLLIYTLAIPKIDGVKCYDAIDADAYERLLENAENSTPNSKVIAQFADGESRAYDSVSRYLDGFNVSRVCTDPNCKMDHVQVSPDKTQVTTPPSEEEIEKARSLHEEGCKKIVENYVSHINQCIVATGLVGIYNRVQKTVPNEGIPDDLRREVHNYFKLTCYKTTIVPLRNREDMGKVIAALSIFDEAETDDTRTLLSQTLAPGPVLHSLTRVQRRTRDKDYVLHCLAFFASLKFDSHDVSDGLRGRDSMYV